MIDYQKTADNARAKGSIALALRIELEIKICNQLLVALAADKDVRKLEINGANISKTATALALSTMTESDEADVIIHYNGEGGHTAYFALVFGNDGYDLINDYGGHKSKELYDAAMKGIST